MPNPRTLIAAPLIDWTPEKLSTFSQLYLQLCQQGASEHFVYRSPYPIYEFLSYLVEKEAVLLHGSNNPNIACFEPNLQTDYMGRMVQAVFATRDGIWPIFFAIIDRAKYRGSLRNTCIWKTDEQGKRRKMYFFSINENQLANDPWTQGTIYVLPRDGFKAVLDYDGNPLEEWACLTEVEPLGKLLVSPQDFPFLDAVEGHTDRLEELTQILLTSFEERCELEDGFSFGYAWTPEREAQLHEVLQLLEEVSMTVQGTVRREPADGSIWLILRGAGVKETLVGIFERISGA